MDYDREEEFPVKLPGRSGRKWDGTHEVVWWDPSKLKLDVEGGLGIRQQGLLTDDGGVSLTEYQAWRAERARVIDQGSTPRLNVFLASQAESAPPDAIAVTISPVTKTGARPGGRRFGTLVHNVLRDVALDAPEHLIHRMVGLNARAIGATEQESEAARNAVAAALKHPLMRAARRRSSAIANIRSRCGWTAIASSKA